MIELIIGIVVGIVLVFAWLSLLSTKQARIDEYKVREIFTEGKKAGSIQYRFDICEKMGKQQLDLLNQLYNPSKSASHSLWKNDIRGQIDIIEREKIDIFKSIISDGIDPMLSVMGPDGSIEKIKMSEAVQRAETETNKPTTNTESKSPRKNGLKIVHMDNFRKEKSNADTNTSPTSTD